SVTLSDEEARRRGTQKVVLERRSPPTFDVLVELQTRHRLVIHEDVAAAVDAHLRGRPLPVEIRYRSEDGQIIIETQQPTVAQDTRNGRRGSSVTPFQPDRTGASRRDDRGGSDRMERMERRDFGRGTTAPAPTPRAEQPEPVNEPGGTGGNKPLQTLHVYAYGVARNRLMQAAKRMHVPLIVEDEFGSAQAIVTLKNYYRRRPKLIVDAERRGIPIHVLRANTVTQMEDFIVDVFQLEATDRDPFDEAIHETEAAIERIRSGARSVDLTPNIPPIRRMQHDMAREAKLVSHSYGREPRRRVRIFRDGTNP
ncbi:MAG: AAA family ATPase, partial [Anaerolineae bacterium]|nr:AAA family ATPase [Anaerolineae bacterium]